MTDTNYPKLVVLTPPEKALLLDRLELDVIPEVMADTYEKGDPLYRSYKDWEWTNLDVLRAVETGQVVLMSAFEEEVLVDALEGSTVMARWWSDWRVTGDQKAKKSYATACRVARRLAAKMSVALGREVSYPTW